MQLNETKGYTLQNEAGIQYLSVPAFDQEGILNCFSTRIGGISEQPYESMNLSLTRPSGFAFVNTLRNVLPSSISYDGAMLVL